jgi:tRNA A37 N6-isopentenylltransferase MiaA
VELALALGGEVVNVDAMQVYWGLPIATAQVSKHNTFLSASLVRQVAQWRQ